MNVELRIAEWLLENLTPGPLKPKESRQLQNSLAATIQRRCGNRIVPKPRESLALSVMTPKTAALAFDRVYRIPLLDSPVPEEIGYYFATASEIIWWSGVLAASVAHQENLEFAGLNLEQIFDGDEPGSAEAERSSLRLICDEFRGRYQVSPTIFYHTPESLKVDFPSGRDEVLHAAISEVALVDEEKLTWEQVLEFRKDPDAVAKYRRLVRWIDEELKSSPPSGVVDLMFVRLDDYKWALEKHGIETRLGTISCLLDPKFLASAGAVVAASGLTAGNLWAALMGASLALGRAALEFGTRQVTSSDMLRTKSYELAYLNEVPGRSI